MTGSEVVSYKEMSPEELMALTGQSTGKKFESFPRLFINKEGMDDAGKAIPSGYYGISQGGITAYAKTVKFRPFINVYNYSVYDALSKTFTNRSIYIKSFSEEAIDEQGGVACGKIRKKNQEGLSEEVLKSQKQIKCYRTIYGAVSGDFKTADDEKQDIVNLPVKLRLSGVNFMPIGEVLDALASKRILMLSCNIILTTKRQKVGTNSWFDLVPNADTDNLMPLGNDDWELLKAFQTEVDRENKYVIDKHKASRGSKDKAENAKTIVQALGDDLNDEIGELA